LWERMLAPENLSGALTQGAAGLDPDEWTPRELRRSFVSRLSDNGVPLGEISRLVGHSSTAVTELVYRKQIRPVLQGERQPWTGYSAMQL
jgi:integrase